eukprot:1149818-Pelagomonas_calceolata.AAC.1
MATQMQMCTNYSITVEHGGSSDSQRRPYARLHLDISSISLMLVKAGEIVSPATDQPEIRAEKKENYVGKGNIPYINKENGDILAQKSRESTLIWKLDLNAESYVTLSFPFLKATKLALVLYSHCGFTVPDGKMSYSCFQNIESMHMRYMLSFYSLAPSPTPYNSLTHTLAFHWALYQTDGMKGRETKSHCYLSTYDKIFLINCYAVFHAYAFPVTTFKWKPNGIMEIGAHTSLEFATNAIDTVQDEGVLINNLQSKPGKCWFKALLAAGPAA